MFRKSGSLKDTFISNASALCAELKTNQYDSTEFNFSMYFQRDKI